MNQPRTTSALDRTWTFEGVDTWVLLNTLREAVILLVRKNTKRRRKRVERRRSTKFGEVEDIAARQGVGFGGIYVDKKRRDCRAHLNGNTSTEK